MKDTPSDWRRKYCPHCGRPYFNPVGSPYQPNTCKDKECIKKELHPELRRK